MREEEIEDDWESNVRVGHGTPSLWMDEPAQKRGMMLSVCASLDLESEIEMPAKLMICFATHRK